MSEPTAKEFNEMREELAKLVHIALLQAGDMQDIEEKAKDIAERSSKITPMPEAPE